MTAKIATAIAAEIALKNAMAVNPYLTHPSTAEAHRTANNILNSLTQTERRAVAEAVRNA